MFMEAFCILNIDSVSVKDQVLFSNCSSNASNVIKVCYVEANISNRTFFANVLIGVVGLGKTATFPRFRFIISGQHTFSLSFGARYFFSTIILLDGIPTCSSWGNKNSCPSFLYRVINLVLFFM